MKLRLILMSLLLSVGASAQIFTKIFHIKHANVDQLKDVMHSFGEVRFESNLGVIVVRGTHSDLAAAEELVKRYDVPPAPARNIELTFHILLSNLDNGAHGKLPPELEPVGRALAKNFQFRSLRLIESTVLRARDRTVVEASGAVMHPAFDPAHPLNYQFRCFPALTGSIIRLDTLKLGFRFPYVAGESKDGRKMFQFRDSSINTEIDVKPGQLVVVGKATMDGSDSSMIAVVSARIVD
jgi:hypothetical protein